MTSERGQSGLSPLVSVVTPVRDGADTIDQTIRSVVTQQYPRIEYIVMDGGSADGTVDIIKRHASRITHWESRPDAGMYFAMNDGIAKATGELVGIINGDDWYEPGAIEAVVTAYLASDRLSVIYGFTRYHDERGVDMVLSYDHSRLPTRMINHPACFVPKALYDRYGGFDTRYRVAADYEFLLRLYRHGVRFVHLERILANFRHGGYSSRNTSGAEVLRIRREHGYLSGGQYLMATTVRLLRQMALALRRA